MRWLAAERWVCLLYMLCYAAVQPPMDNGIIVQAVTQTYVFQARLSANRRDCGVQLISCPSDLGWEWCGGTRSGMPDAHDVIAQRLIVWLFCAALQHSGGYTDRPRALSVFLSVDRLALTCARDHCLDRRVTASVVSG
ncbi:hypothetical protein B0J12DRAFT_230380 [Macrophomina phaseolina]|uniref:Secreted protein n=1 Tax=Macrophomina phaseolina TaxID=35725 RepID=A0ABQ8GPV8_9PEZI|nr:hypothetical protein B0J12DRAFT_230380 [Macrophomina phaseolina]